MIRHRLVGFARLACLAAPLLGCMEAADEGGASLSTYLEGLCESVGGPATTVDHDCTAMGASPTTPCEIDELQTVTDRDYGSYAIVSPPHGQGMQIIARSSEQMPQGRAVGALIRVRRQQGGFLGVPDGSFEMRVTTYEGGGTQESGVALSSAEVGVQQNVAPGTRASRGADGFYGIRTSLPYDAIEIEITDYGTCRNTDTGCPAIRVYEICTREAS